MLQLSSKGEFLMGRVVWMLLCFALMWECGEAQERGNRHIVVTVSYVTSQTVYLDGGKNRAIAAGDSGVVYRHRVPSGRLVVTGVSSSSASARLVVPSDSVSVGDTVVVSSSILAEDALAAGGKTTQEPQVSRQSMKRGQGFAHGRIGFQYSSLGEAGGSLVFSRPSLVVYLTSQPLAGSGLSLTVHGRVDGSLGSSSGLWAGKATTMRMYDLSIAMDDSRQWYGFAAGRISSAYVGGLGLFDGIQLLARVGPFAIGGVGGFQPDYRTSGFNSQIQKVAGFVSVTWPMSQSSRGSSTFAYGQQLFHGNLDRDFLFLQNGISISNSLNLYQSTEIDLHKNNGDGRKGDFRLTNTFLSAHYQPLDWLHVNFGYDATRRIEYLETDKNLLDSLLDRDLRQGFRSSILFRLPLNASISLLGGYRLPAGGLPSGNSAGSCLRLANIAGSGFSADAQYMHVRSPYTNGNDVTGGIDYAPFWTMTMGVHWNQYAFTSLGQIDGGRYMVSTWTGSVNWNIPSGWYFTIFADRIRDNGSILFRCFAETGYHF
jgi:hypothetical protein